jgi:hypothetical protein
MFADNEIKTPPSPAQPTDPGARTFLNKIGDFLSWLATPPPLPLTDAAPADWYAGLCAVPSAGLNAGASLEASGFSDQLCRLQKALQPAGQPVAPVETAKLNSSHARS